MIAKIAMTEGIDPVIFTFLRNLIATPLVLLFAYFIEALPRPQKEDYFPFFVLGLFGIAFNQLFFLLGMKLTSSVNASLFQVFFFFFF